MPKQPESDRVAPKVKAKARPKGKAKAKAKAAALETPKAKRPRV